MLLSKLLQNQPSTLACAWRYMHKVEYTILSAVNPYATTTKNKVRCLTSIQNLIMEAYCTRVAMPTVILISFLK